MEFSESDLNFIKEGGSVTKFNRAFMQLLKTTPYSKITISELCKQAGLSRKTFYKHYSGIEALVESIYDGFALLYLRQLTSMNAQVTNYERFLTTFSFWYRFRDYVEMLVRNDLWNEKRLIKYERHSMVDTAEWSGTPFDSPEHRYYLYVFLGAGCLRVVESWCQNGFRETPEELANLVSYILDGDLNTNTDS